MASFAGAELGLDKEFFISVAFIRSSLTNSILIGLAFQDDEQEEKNVERKKHQMSPPWREVILPSSLVKINSAFIGIGGVLYRGKLFKSNLFRSKKL